MPLKRYFFTCRTSLNLHTVCQVPSLEGRCRSGVETVLSWYRLTVWEGARRWAYKSYVTRKHSNAR